MTKEEEVWWDRIEESEEEIAELKEFLVKEPQFEESIKKDLAFARKRRKLCACVVPHYKPRPSRRKARQAERVERVRQMCADFNKRNTHDSDKVCTDPEDGNEK